LKDGHLIRLALLYGNQIQPVGQDLWLSGGLTCVVRVTADSLREREREQQEPLDYTKVGPADGLLSDECTTGYPNMTTTKDGKLWVATMGGAAMLDLAKLPPSAGRPFEYVSEIEVDRKKRNAGRELILAPGLHHTEIQLSSIELSSPERAHIQYRLEGIDSEWLDAKPDGIAVYTTIPHGAYLFHVRASNGDGIWDRQGIVYRITQEPFFYETSTFRILMIVVGCILLTIAYRFRLRQEAERIKVRLEERVAERERVARDLHDTLLQSFHGLMLHFQVVYKLLPTGKAKEQLEETLERADRAIAEGRSTVYDLRSSALAANDLSEALRGVGNDLANENTATFGLVVEGPTRELQPIIRDEFYRISREALRNASREIR
jgi:hypothetical protein